jgi:hypothetical protein
LATVVCRGLPDSPLLVVTTQRPLGSGGGATTAALLEQLNGHGVPMPVGALDQEAVAAQAAALAGTNLTPEEGAWLYRASGGNPFFVEQLVRWSITREAAGMPGELPVSAAVRRVVGERLAGLDADARRLMTVGAVAGDEVDLDILATVTGLPPGRFGDAVAEAVAAGILWRRSSEHPACGLCIRCCGRPRPRSSRLTFGGGCTWSWRPHLRRCPPGLGGWPRSPFTVARRCRLVIHR